MIVLTADRRIRYRETEKRALLEAGVAAFVLTAGSQTGAEQAQACIRALAAMDRMLAKQAPPFIARISRTGDVALLE